MTTVTLAETLAEVAARHGSLLRGEQGKPTFRLQRQYGLQIALGLGDPLHPYPELIDTRLASVDGLLAAIAAISHTGTDLLRLRYLAEGSVPDLADLPVGTTLVRHETCVADLRRTPELPPISMDKLVRRRSKWVQLQKEHGSLSFRIAEAPNVRIALIECMIAWKRAWFKQRGINARGFNDPFHIAALRTLAATGNPRMFRIHSLLAEDEPIAIEACIVSSETLLNLIIAGRPELRHFGPGVLLSKLALSHASQDGVGKADFLPPSSPHKEHLTDCKVPKVELRVPLTLAGRLSLSTLERAGALKERLSAMRG